MFYFCCRVFCLYVMTVLRGQNYYWFLMFRTMVGIGEASYSTIAPTIISDMFVQDMRSKMLALFYFAIPVGRSDTSSQVAYSSQVVGASRRSVRVYSILLLILLEENSPWGYATPNSFSQIKVFCIIFVRRRDIDTARAVVRTV